MPKRARAHKQVRFDLYMDDVAEDRLRRFLVDLSYRGKMRDWIVAVLLKAMDQSKEAK